MTEEFPSARRLGVTPLAIDLSKALNQDDLTFNLDLHQSDTKAFFSFANAIRLANSCIFRMRQGDAVLVPLIRAFLEAEGLLHEHGKTDPRMPYIFARLLVDLDDYDYALDSLRTLEAVLVVPSPAISSAIYEVQRCRARRVHESHQALSQLNASNVGWAYSTTSCAPLPITLVPIQVPIIQFAPFTANRLSQIELGRLLRAIAIHTNVLEGVLDLSAMESYNLINNGFAALCSTRRPDEFFEYTHQVLLDSQAATQVVLDRIGSGNVKFDDAFVCELHKIFTKTACMAGQRAAYIGRGRYKFLSNHVFARNGAYHVFCRPGKVAAEMKKLFGMSENYLGNIQRTPENGIWLAAWFHHRFVNIHPFRDGNGRVTRALVSAILCYFGLLPLLVNVEDKDDYFRALMAADADGSNLAPLAKFIACQQLHSFFLCKTQTIPIPLSQVPSSEFRRRRIEEAHMFIQQKASEVSVTYKRTVNQIQNQGWAPFLTVKLHDQHVLELVKTGVTNPEFKQRVYLIYGSLYPLETDIFVLYIVTPCVHNNSVGSVRSVTGVGYNEATDVWESRLGRFLLSDLDNILRLVTEPVWPIVKRTAIRISA